MLQSELIEDAKAIVGDMADLAQTWTTVGGGTSWQVLIGTPTLSQEMNAGGFIERTNHEVRLVASTASWTTAYGTACAAAISSGALVSSLAIGKTLVATEQGNLKYRIVGTSFKPGSGWVTLTVRLEDER